MVFHFMFTVVECTFRIVERMFRIAEHTFTDAEYKLYRDKIASISRQKSVNIIRYCNGAISKVMNP